MMSSFGIKVSKPGYDARTAVDKHLILTTELPVLKVAQTGTFTLTGSVLGADVTIPHNLGYEPQSLVIMQFVSGGRFRRANSFGNSNDDFDAIFYTDSQNLYVSVINYADLTGNSYQGYYYIFYDPIKNA